MDSLSDLIRCDYSVLQNVIRDILARLKNQEDKVATLENTIREKDAHINKLTNQLNEGLHVVNNFNSKFGNLGERLHALEEAVNLHTDQITNTNHTVTGILSRLDKLDFGGDGSGLTSKDIADRLATLENSTSRIDELEQGMQHLQQNKLDKSEFESQFKDIENGIKNLQEQVARQSSMLREQANTLSKLDGLTDPDSQGGLFGRKNIDLSNFVEKSQYDSDIAALQEADSNHASEIRKIWTAIKKLRSEQSELAEAGNVRDSQISELRTAIGALGKLVNSLTDTVNNLADKRDLLLLRDDLLKQLKDTANILREHMKNELKRFEGDLMLYLDEREQQQEVTETAIGKVYFRCLTCNQPTQTQHGPHSKYYQYTQGNAINTSGVAVPLKSITNNPTNGGLIIEKGNDMTVHGMDGNVYKGRDDSTVHFTPTSTLHEEPKTSRLNNQFKVTYSDKSDPSNRGNISRNSTSRGVGGNNGSIAYARPQSARLPLKYDGTNETNHILKQKQSQLTETFDGNTSGSNNNPLSLEDGTNTAANTATGGRAKTAHLSTRRS